MTCPRPAAGRAIDRARARLGAFAVALRAGVEFADLNLLIHAERRFLERDLHVVAQIGAALPSFAIRRGPAAEKRLEDSSAAAAATENFPENIERIVETAAASRGPLGERGVAEAIVGRALVGIHQDVVGFAELFEFLLGVRVVRVFVGVKLDRELAVGALHFLFGRGPRDGQDFVIIALFGRHRLVGRIGRM